MKTLDRNRIDQLVRELETDAYRLALAVALDPAAAERIVLAAFASLAPALAATPQIVELKERLQARIRQRGSRAGRSVVPIDERADQAVAVSDSLHLRIVDLLEEEQDVEPVGRRRAVFVGLGGIVIVAALAAYLWVRVDALAVAQPTVTAVGPPAGAKEVPIRGDFRVTFGQRPAGTPTLRFEPADGTVDPAHWDGNTLVTGYSGLHLATQYQLVLVAEYRSRLKDIGHYEKRWTVTTEGYPVLVSVFPQEGGSVVPRVGQLSIDFNHRPPVDPHVSLEPADGVMLLPAQWNGMTLEIQYSGLKPLTRYQATVTVDYGVKEADIRQQWAFSTEPGAPPAGVPVIWYGTSSPWSPSSGTQRLVAIDWSGNLVGTVYQAFATQQAPDGSAFFTSDRGLVDRTGAQVSTPTGFRSNPMIADDSKGLCDVVDLGGQLWLMTGPVGGPVHRVAPLGAAGDRSGPVIIACSALNDRAVLADIGMGGTTAVRVIGLRTGRVFYQRSYAGVGLGVTSSRDGRYLAEQIPSYDAQGQPLSSMSSIRRTSDGRVVAHVDGRRVVRFSWDGMRVVTGPFFAGVGPNDAELLDWQTGKILWRLPGATSGDGPRTIYAMPQPNQSTMAIAVSSQPSSGDVDQLWLVGADGRATQAVSQIFYPAFYSGF